jgi:hypothetical protein
MPLDPLFIYEVRRSVSKAFLRRSGVVCICDTPYPYTLSPDGYGGRFLDGVPPIGKRYSGPREDELSRFVTQRNNA